MNKLGSISFIIWDPIGFYDNYGKQFSSVSAQHKILEADISLYDSPSKKVFLTAAHRRIY